MTSTTVYSDVVLPAATWYEKHDLNTTDMHPFVHSFNPAIAPPWQTRTDFAIFKALSEEFSRQAATHLGVRKDLVAAPLTHDTPDEYANPHGIVRDWKAGECDPVPGVSMPKLVDGGARLRRRRGEVGGAGAAGREARTAGQGHGLDAGQGGRLPAGQERRGPRRRGGRAPVAGPRRRLVRDDPRARRHHERPGRDDDVPAARGAHGGEAGRPRGRARGQAHHLRRHAGAARPGDHLAGVVGQRARRAALLAVHGQRRAAQTVAHAHRAPTFLPRPRLDDRAGRADAGIPPTAGHERAVRRAAPRRDRRAGADAALPHPAQQVVDPLRVPGQPVHALAVARRASTSG